VTETVSPLVSIIIPLYNHARYIERCLDSIADDAYPGTEIIMIDDGSRDDSHAVVERWSENRGAAFHGEFRFIRRENRGVTRTLNELVSLASGEYVAVLASDDYLLPGGISARVEYLRAHPEKMAVFADCTVVDDHGVGLHASGLADIYGAQKEFLANDELLPYELIINWCVPGPVFMARRELYDLVGTYDETLAIEDWDFYLRLLARNLLGFVDFPVAAYRLHSGSSLKDRERSVILQQNLVRTVTKNLDAFTGLKRFLLLGLRTRMIGTLAAHTRENRVMGSLYRKAGRRMLKLGKLLFRIRVLRPVRHRQQTGT
jgi:alpha-1,6-rhamnosyltransferase